MLFLLHLVENHHLDGVSTCFILFAYMYTGCAWKYKCPTYYVPYTFVSIGWIFVVVYGVYGVYEKEIIFPSSHDCTAVQS